MGADMVNLTQLRGEVLHELTQAGLAAVSWAANTLPPPPCAVVGLSEPYLTLAGAGSGGSFDCPWIAHLEIELAAGRGPDEQVVAELDSLIRTTVLALTTGEYTKIVPGDGTPRLVEVRPFVGEDTQVVGAYVAVDYPINMKES